MSKTGAAAEIGGVYPMLYAFWDGDGRLDHRAMDLQVGHVLEAGADGVAVLGLVTESHRMDARERLALTRSVGQRLGGECPYSVTITGETVDEQRAFADAALEAGADWLILQPPLKTVLGEAELIAFFAAIAEGLACPLGVQNNPEHLKNAFSAAGLIRLHEAVPAITIAKAEGPVVTAEPLIDATRASLRSFGGHGGIEHTRLLRAGAHGLIPAPDCLPLQIRIDRLWAEGTEEARAEAEAIETELLPLIVFMNRSIDVLLCYGRQFMARRLGLEDSFDRFGTLRPTPFGLAEMDRLYERLSETEARYLG
ncbi:dihydrodipicolinate synthase family protein [Arsenicitalea aurantiaca]|uniref:Dihydrodipicolinate synthase family protein n=1 Tax=Arsenicitalea aurantiaca TaxID=1783274 RepID=A0A433XB20_9HYPH|nr:dihydrodipicolinate synthase family protein [Arsenicitalea aurantiaca]RUT31287.1 dihydrodipicolinate synthase family protein [Arsenicitalea aurantiaca]